MPPIRSRSLFYPVTAAGIALIITGCASKDLTPKAEVRLPRTANAAEMEASWGDETAAQDVSSQDGFTPDNSWTPAGAPDSGAVPPSSEVSFDPFDNATPAETAEVDAETGDFVNNEAGEGVEDGAFAAELEMIHFPFDSFEITGDFVPTLENHAEWLQEHPQIMVQVEGHCDERGTEEYNLALGQKRADAVRTFLIEQGVQADRLSTISYGKMRPLTFETDEASHALNRRAMFLVYELEGGAESGGEVAFAE